MRGHDVTLAGYLYNDLNKERLVDPDTGEKESWTQYFCRTHGKKYYPHGIRPKTRKELGAKKSGGQ